MKSYYDGEDGRGQYSSPWAFADEHARKQRPPEAPRDVFRGWRGLLWFLVGCGVGCLIIRAIWL